MVDDAFGRDSLAEIGLDSVHAHIEESRDVTRKPLTGGRIGEIHDGHSRLPEIGLPDRAVRVA